MAETESWAEEVNLLWRVEIEVIDLRDLVASRFDDSRKEFLTLWAWKQRNFFVKWEVKIRFMTLSVLV